MVYIYGKKESKGETFLVECIGNDFETILKKSSNHQFLNHLYNKFFKL